MSKCIECSIYIPQNVHNYSMDEFNVPLCRDHQEWIRNSDATEEAINLYFALRMTGIPAKLEKFDGNKTIDIAIPEFKLNIEVDGIHHNLSPRQALTDLKRTYHSFLKGYLTLRIPNSLVQYDLDATVNCITDFLNENKGKGGQRYLRH